MAGQEPVCGLYRDTVVQNSFYNCLKTVPCFNILCNVTRLLFKILFWSPMPSKPSWPDAQAEELETTIAQTLIEPEGRIQLQPLPGVFGITGSILFITPSDQMIVADDCNRKP